MLGGEVRTGESITVALQEGRHSCLPMQDRQECLSSCHEYVTHSFARSLPRPRRFDEQPPGRRSDLATGEPKGARMARRVGFRFSGASACRAVFSQRAERRPLENEGV
jgi:hypothetical protein